MEDKNLKELIEQFNAVKDKIVVSFIEKRDEDPNWRKYPEKKYFEIKTYDEVRSYEKRGYCCAVVMFPPCNGFKTGSECLLELDEDDVNNIINVASSNEVSFYKECKYHNILFQNVGDAREPYTVVTGDEDFVTSKLQDYLANKKISTYESWSGAGYNNLADRVEVHHNLEVNGIPDYGKKTTYPVAYKLTPNTILNLKEAQRLIIFGTTESTYRHVTFGTGYRVTVSVLDKDDYVKTGRLWVSHDPLD